MIWAMLPVLFLFPYKVFSQAVENAPDYKISDCNGNPLDLYQELSAGKVVVLGWAMPCATCVSPLLSVHNAILNFAVSKPGKVSFWLLDDYANTPCETFKSWCTNNGLLNAKYAVSKDVKMTDFGSNGMPKVVVIGCQSGKVYYNINNTPEGTGVTAAINAALADIEKGCLASGPALNERTFKLYPNPCSSSVYVLSNYDWENPEVRVSNLFGQTVLTSSLELKSKVEINLSGLIPGSYFIEIKDENKIYREKILKVAP